MDNLLCQEIATPETQGQPQEMQQYEKRVMIRCVEIKVYGY